MDPRAGSRAAGLASVTVVDPELATADAYSTAIMALGLDGLEWLRRHPEVDAMAITDEREVFTTAGFDRRRIVEPGTPRAAIIETCAPTTSPVSSIPDR